MSPRCPNLKVFARFQVTDRLYNNASEMIRDEFRRLIVQRQIESREPPIPPHKEKIRAEILKAEEEFRKIGVTSLALFGSVVRGGQRPGSDIDVVIEHAPGRGLNFLRMAAVGLQLEDRLGCRVDVVSREGLEKAYGKEAFEAAERVF